MNAHASTRTATQDRRPPEGAEPTAQSSGPALASVLQALLSEVWALVREHLLLIALEAQRAGRTITRMVFAGVVAAVLLVTGWLALIASAMFWLVAGDPPWAQAFFAVGLLHAAISAALIVWIRRLAADAMFSATLRQLAPDHKAEGEGA